MKEILPGIYTENVRIGLPEIPSLNLTVIKGCSASGGEKGESRSLLIDSGLRDSASFSCSGAIEKMMHELDIPFDRLDCLITHTHQDHIGQAPFLRSRGARVFMNPEERAHEDDMIFYRASDEKGREELLHTMGLSRIEDPERYDGFSEAVKRNFEGCASILDFDFLPLSPGDTVSYGSYVFEAIRLKGHTCGQTGLWDGKRKVIFCADHIMKGVSPFVGCCSDTSGYLTEYLHSMEDVKHRYRDSLFIPGHGEAFREPEKEADRIIYSYLNKCSLMIAVLRTAKKPMCIFDIAVRVYGRNMISPPDSLMPSCLLILAKTYACLLYMKDHGLAEESSRDGVPYWIAKIPSRVYSVNQSEN